MSLTETFRQNFTKDGTNNLHPGKVISSIIVLISLIGFVIYNEGRLKDKTKDRYEHRRYTIGVTGAKHHNLRSSKPTVRFYYNVLGKQYEGNGDIDAAYENNALPKGRRYFVEYSAMRPDNSRILLGYPVPADIIYAPDSGWAEIPK